MPPESRVVIMEIKDNDSFLSALQIREMAQFARAVDFFEVRSYQVPTCFGPPKVN
jgi:hypothetical protein